jgi:hypothetical protein
MMNLTEQVIRTRAYELWKAAGEPEGNGKMDSGTKPNGNCWRNAPKMHQALGWQ